MSLELKLKLSIDYSIPNYALKLNITNLNYDKQYRKYVDLSQKSIKCVTQFWEKHNDG